MLMAEMLLTLDSASEIWFAQKNPQHPDFRHRRSNEALWIESPANPPWVKEKLSVMSSHHLQARESFHFLEDHGAPSGPGSKRFSSSPKFLKLSIRC